VHISLATSRAGNSIDCDSCRSLFRPFFPYAAVAVNCKLVPILAKKTCPLRAGPCGQSALAHFAPPTHRTRRGGLDSSGGPCRLPSRAGRDGYAPVPARRAGQRHRPPFQIVATTKVAIQRSCHHEQELFTQANEALDAITINSDRSDHATRNGVTGACLPPSIVWLGRTVKVVFWRRQKKTGVAWSSARTSTVDCAPFARGRAFRKARAESALCFRGKLWLTLSRMALFHATP
jgi:hypothetical protein